MQAVLVMFRSDGERRSFSITRDMTVIGRREDSDLRIPLGDVSRKHCRLVREDEGIRLEDLGSSNGTYHNGHRVEKEAHLQAGDSIQVGPVVFVLQLDGVPADEELHPITSDAAALGYDPNRSAGEAPQPPTEGVGSGYADPMDALEPLPAGGDFDVTASGGMEEINELEPLPLEDLPPEMDELEEIPFDEHAQGGPPPLDELEIDFADEPGDKPPAKP